MSGSLTIRELCTVWGFQVDDKALDGLDKRMAKLQSTVRYVGGLAVGAAAAMFGLATSAGEAGAGIKHAAERIGITTDALQEFQYAARLSGQSSEGFQGSLQTLVKNLFDARRGLGSAREAFYLLGHVMGKDLLAKGRSAEEILNDVANGLNLVADPSRKLELAGQLFGGDAGAMLTTLKGGAAGLEAMRAEARATGVVMSGAAVEAADGYRRALERTKSTLTGLKNSIGVALFPVVERVMAQFTRWIAVNRAWLASGLQEGFRILETYIGRVIYVVERVAGVANVAAMAFGGWAKVVRFLTTAMTVLLALRIAASVGSMVQVAFKAIQAFKLFGNAALLANLEILALGAAVVGLLLIIEDVVAYFQGKKSITGELLGDFKGSGKGLSTFIGDMLDSAAKKLDTWMAKNLPLLKAMGARIGRALVDGLSELTDADLEAFGGAILKALVLIGKGTIALFQIGVTIADGIIEGLVAGLRKRFPTLAKAIGLDDDLAAGGKGLEVNGGKANGLGGWKGSVLTDDGQGGRNWVGKALDAINGVEATSQMQMAPAGVPAGFGAGVTNIQIDARQTVNVPAGTPAEKINGINQKSLENVVDDAILRQTNAATKPKVKY